jgi:hypothetical protein
MSPFNVNDGTTGFPASDDHADQVQKTNNQNPQGLLGVDMYLALMTL